jgi:hypothetical protein
MRIRRLTIAVAALTAAIGLSGCGPEQNTAAGGAGPAAAESAATPADPAAELAAAAAKLTEDSLKVKTSMAAGLNAEGVADKAGEQMDMTMTIGDGSGDEAAMTVDLRKIGTDVYMKFDGALGAFLGDRADKWMHIDAAKVPADSPFSMEANDPRNAAEMLGASARVQKTGDRTFSGVLDMTKSPTADEESLKALGDKATAVPFTATADEQGRLVELVIDVAAIAPGSGKMTTTYSDFGTPVSVTAPPASEVIEMPKEMMGVVDA